MKKAFGALPALAPSSPAIGFEPHIRGQALAQPVVSVLIDTYNHERFIEQAITSVVEQDLPASEREIIVVDDGSTDSTPEVLRKFLPHVRVLRKSNGGQASAFNAGLAECRGQIISFLDGDDWWASSKLSTVIGTLQAHPEVSAVGHAIHEADESGTVLATLQPNRAYRCALHDIADVREFLPLRAFLGTSRFTIRRSLLSQILPVPEEIRIEADEFLFTLAAAHGVVAILPEPLGYYRIHSGNLYQFGGVDTVRTRQKQKAIVALEHELRVRLSKSRLTVEARNLAILPTWIDAQRLSLSLGDGRPLQTFHAERAAYGLAHSHVSSAYRLFQAATLGLSLLLPPMWFYRLRNWYAARGLHRLRARVARSSPADTVTVRCVHP